MIRFCGGNVFCSNSMENVVVTDALRSFVRRKEPVLEMTEAELTAAMKDIPPEKYETIQREIKD